MMRVARSPFKERPFTVAVILRAVRRCLRFAIRYRDLERMLAERGVADDRRLRDPGGVRKGKSPASSPTACPPRRPSSPACSAWPPENAAPPVLCAPCQTLQRNPSGRSSPVGILGIFDNPMPETSVCASLKVSMFEGTRHDRRQSQARGTVRRQGTCRGFHNLPIGTPVPVRNENRRPSSRPGAASGLPGGRPSGLLRGGHRPWGGDPLGAEDVRAPRC